MDMCAARFVGLRLQPAPKSGRRLSSTWHECMWFAGMMVLEAFKVVQNKIDKCLTVYCNRDPNGMKKILVPTPLLCVSVSVPAPT